MFANISSRRDLSQILVVGLVASFLVLISPFAQESRADYTSWKNDGNIQHNDRQCDLGDPSLHSTSATAFVITNSAQLWEVTDCVSTSATIHFRLGDDIDVTAPSSVSGGFTDSPIGLVDVDNVFSFSGVLDGDGYLVHGNSMSATAHGVGLFGLLDGATISNLAIAGSFQMVGNTADERYAAGSLAFRAVNSSSIVSVYNLANVSGEFYVGGILGHVNGNVSIADSQNFGSITAEGADVGGLVGKVTGDVNISRATNSGQVLSRFDGDVGGLVGDVVGDASISEAANSETIQGDGDIGGLIGKLYGYAFINRSKNTAQIITSGGDAGGLLGDVGDDVAITSSHNTGNITSTGGTDLGGLVGLVDTGNLTVEHSYNTGDVTGPDDNHGGIVGSVESGDAFIKSSFNSGDITSTGGANIGGLIGWVEYDAQIESSWNSGQVSADDGTGGGLVGYAEANLAVSLSFNTGAVSGFSFLGGLTGYVEGSSNIELAYNSGVVTASNNVAGGLIGKAVGPSSVQEAYNSGTVSAPIGTDGLLGSADASVTTVATYTVGGSDYGTVSSIANLKIASTYVGFSFPSVWAFGTCSENNGFPVLVAFGALANYYSYSCGSNTAPTLGSQSGSNPRATAPAPSYVGPVIESPRATAQAGSSLQLTGEKLHSVTSVEIGGVLVEVIARDATSITLELPASIEPGTYDLVISSGFGTLTVMGAVVISAAVPKASELGELLGFSWTGAFTGNSRSLNQIQVMTIESALEKQPTATTVICWGYTTASSPNAWAIAHATQRAQAACNLVAQLNSEIKTAVRLRYGVKKSYAMRTSLQFWELKPAPYAKSH